MGDDVRALHVPLVGPAGEPVNLRRTLVSHGTFSLPPAAVDEESGVLEITVPLPRSRPRTILIEDGSPGLARVTVLGRTPGRRTRAQIKAVTRRLLNLDEDLSAFYAAVAHDPELAWVARGAGRMGRSPTVFEDVVKTICTTNCSWASTTRMLAALVEHVGEPAAGAPADGWRGRSFPTPEAMGGRDERFYREVVRAGYRAPHLLTVARSVADGTLDLEVLLDPDLPDEEVEARLLALPGVGPYAAAHIMLTLGRYGKLILDSWTRPTYARIAGHPRVPSDRTILRRFRRYGRHAGLAFWCLLTRDWVPGGAAG